MNKKAIAAERFANVVLQAWEVVNRCEDPSEPPGMPERVEELRAALEQFAEAGTIPEMHPGQPVFLRPQEGDVCVLAFPIKLSMADMEKMREAWEKQAPGVKVVVVNDCSGVQSFRPAKEGEDDG